MRGLNARAWTWVAAMAALVGLIGAAALGVAVSEAPAGNRGPAPTLVEFPGPEQVTFGENVAYTASLPNDQSSNFTHVIYRHRVPTTGPGAAATLIYASCDPTRTNWVPDSDGFYSCPEMAQVPAGTTAKVLLVFRTPGNPNGMGDNVTCDATNNCLLASNGYWIIKEGTGKPGSSGPDTFPPLDKPLTVTTDLLGAAPDLSKARGYIMDECATGSSLATSTSVPVGPSNRLATTVCATSVPGIGVPLHPGLLLHLDEKGGGVPPGLGKRITETSFVCIPAPPDDDNTGMCPADPNYGNQTYEPWSFDDPATFTFTIDNTTLPNGEKIDQVAHNGVIVTGCTITIDNKTKTTKVTCKAPVNGWWDFG